MEAKLTTALFKNVMETCEVMDAKAFVIVELSSGERFWAGNGAFKDEFINKGRILNGDDVEIDIKAEDNEEMEEEEEKEENKDEGVKKMTGKEKKNQKSRKKWDEKQKARKLLLKNANNDNDEDDLVSTDDPNDETTTDLDKAPSTQNGIKRKNEVDHSAANNNEEIKKMKGEVVTTTTTANGGGGNSIPAAPPPAPSRDTTYIWMNHPISHWMQVAADVRQAAIEQSGTWHDEHPVLLEPDYHLQTHLKFRLLNPTRYLGTSFWVNMKPRRICSLCLCYMGKKDGDASVMKKHTEQDCAAICCGQRRCQKCGHAHQTGTPCNCTCWTDTLKALHVEFPSIGRNSQPPTATKDASKSNPDPPPAKSGKSGKSAKSVSPKEVSKQLQESLITWNGIDLAANLLLVDEIVEREAEEDHRPLNDLRAHMTLWMENAAAGRYFNFFSHILVNGFCQGCCCFKTGGDNDVVSPNFSKHPMHDCDVKCCGNFLCKLCLHKHELDQPCSCKCVSVVVGALGLEMPDMKVQESTKSKWSKARKDKDKEQELKEDLEKKRLNEISDW